MACSKGDLSSFFRVFPFPWFGVEFECTPPSLCPSQRKERWVRESTCVDFCQLDFPSDGVDESSTIWSSPLAFFSLCLGGDMGDPEGRSGRIKRNEIKRKAGSMLKFLLLVNKQGQIRLSKYYRNVSRDERLVLEGQLIRKCLLRGENQCPFMKFNGYKIIYRRYASLYFIMGLEDSEKNELAYLELIHFIVETLDKYFENVCELDIMFNLDKTHIIIEEILMCGLVSETNKLNILDHVYLLEKASQNSNDDINSMIIEDMRDALLKTRIINCLSVVLDQFQSEKFIRSNVAKQILDNSCEAMHEVLDSLTENRDNQQNIFDSEMSIQGKIMFHRYHRKKWKMCVDSSDTWVIRFRRLQGAGKPENIKLGENRKLLIEAVDMKNCDVLLGVRKDIDTYQVKKDLVLYYPLFQRG
ncbi:clathrin assembly protein [Cryptosporidium ryanae]|uniref:clathrin assembly protein n=1 Tax=Cryptosporidium ryanae TaxID=515981 RepID=UPI00351A81A7|nr:clathrin assembly protein [Cryptosporidium ryanae]